MPPAWNGTLIGRLRVQSGERDAFTVQQRVARLMTQMELQPRGLAPTAILCLRRLRDPKPGQLSLRANDASPAWQAAVNARLDEYVQRAARPAKESIPPDAEAVLFADRAELLACLARDWLRGETGSRWWWQGLFRLDNLRETVMREWLTTPEHAPPALHELSVMGYAAPFVSAMDEPTTTAFLENIMRRFGLGALASLDVLTHLRRSQPPPESPVKAAFDQPLLSFPGAVSRTVAMSEWPNPFRRWAPETDAPLLAVEQRVVLGIALMLQRAPAELRSPAFGAILLEWTKRVAEETSSGAPHVPDTVPRNIPSASAHLPSAPAPHANHKGRGRSSQSSRMEPPSRVRARPSPARDAPIPFLSRAEPVSQAPVADAQDAWQNLAATTTATEYGGVFYLVNLALYLNLYGDFSTPLEPGLALSPWDFLALVGRELIGERFPDDPVWTLLAQLAGRDPDAPPGKNFAAPNEWRIPPEWLKPFPDKTAWTWTYTRKRLRVIHPAGFVILDIARSGEDAKTHTQREILAYRKSRIANRNSPVVRRPSSVRPPSQAQRIVLRWLSWLMPYLTARLQRALGIDDSNELARRVCEHSARVRVTATNVDVVLSLAELPIEIRYAGLDRDPGWIPAAGRFVAFHFE